MTMTTTKITTIMFMMTLMMIMTTVVTMAMTMTTMTTITAVTAAPTDGGHELAGVCHGELLLGDDEVGQHAGHGGEEPEAEVRQHGEHAVLRTHAVPAACGAQAGRTGIAPQTYIDSK